jgi:hypothetical protein
MRIQPQISFAEYIEKIEGARSIYDLRFLVFCINRDGFFSNSELSALQDEIHAREFVLEAVKILASVSV